MYPIPSRNTPPDHVAVNLMNQVGVKCEQKKCEDTLVMQTLSLDIATKVVVKWSLAFSYFM